MKIKDIPQKLSEIKKEDRFREVRDLRMITASKGIDRSGKEYIVFNSNDYLGMTHEPEVQEAARKAIIYGTGSGGARLTSGAVFELSDLEKELASFKHTEDAVIFNTGYMTNLGVLYALAGPADVIFSDELNHASIVDGCRISRAKVVVYKHSDMRDLEKKLQETETRGQRFIYTDGVFSMDGDVALPELIDLKETYDACLIVDDAHSTGVIGEKGHGTSEYWGRGGIDIQVGTLSKALGAEGGFVASTRNITDYLRNCSRPFIFSTSISSVTGATALSALKLLEREPGRFMGKLMWNASYMRKLLKDAGLPIVDAPTPIIPIIMGEETKALHLAARCREEGVLLSAIRPPSVPKGTSRIRLTVTAAHTKEELERAASVIIKNYKK